MLQTERGVSLSAFLFAAGLKQATILVFAGSIDAD
jgi:hypothetical protein